MMNNGVKKSCAESLIVRSIGVPLAMPGVYISRLASNYNKNKLYKRTLSEKWFFLSGTGAMVHNIASTTTIK